MAGLFLAPLLLAAAALAAVPWYLHHIRRPERDPVPFSSLMFVPDVKREVIERRRIQHLLLMLLRMLLLALLALAFARPYVPLLAASPLREGAPRHAVLLDVSYSMDHEAALAAARGALNGLEPNAAAGVIAFAQSPRVLAPLGDLAEARLALAGAKPTLLPTDYEAALRAAELMLTEALPPGAESPLTVHLVSDFLKSGMPESHSGWKLAPGIRLDPIPIAPPSANLSVAEIEARPAESGMRVRAKIRSWPAAPEKAVEVRIGTGEERIETQRLDAALASFDLPADTTAPVSGWIEIADENLLADNRRYFAWNPKPRQRLAALGAADPAQRWPAALLLRHALPETEDAPWTWTDDLASAGAAIATGATDANALAAFLRGGGKALIAARDLAPFAPLLAEAGIEFVGMRYGEANEAQFALFSWIDFAHPIFRPFRGARYNDFSDIRFYNHAVLTAGDAARILARFEADENGTEHPAVIEAELGEGRFILWAFPISLDWATLPKSSRFVPLLHETLAHLDESFTAVRDWRVGENPGEQFAAPGIIEHRNDSEGAPASVESVNVDPRESDLTPIAPAELALRLCADPVLPANAEDIAQAGPEDAPIEKREYGRWIAAFVFILLFVEQWYAGKLT